MKISTEPKYFRIKRELTQDILSGKYMPGSRTPSVRALMKQYKISNSTSSRITKELVEEGLVNSVHGKGCFVAGVTESRKPEKKSKMQALLKNRKLMFIIPDVLNAFYTAILRGILDAVQHQGYHLEIYGAEHSYRSEIKLLSSCLEKPIAGLIYIPFFNDKKYKQLFFLHKKGIPVVFLDRKITGFDFDFVGIDHFEGARKLVNYLVGMGHRRIAFIRRDKNIISTEQRYLGYSQALREAGIEVDPRLVFSTDEVEKTPADWIKIYEQTNEFLRGAGFTALLAHCGYEGKYAYNFLKKEGRDVPGDVSLVTFDDSAEFENLGLTSVRQDTYSMGRKAAELLIGRIESAVSDETGEAGKPEEIMIKTTLMVRKSVRKIDQER